MSEKLKYSGGYLFCNKSIEWLFILVCFNNFAAKSKEKMSKKSKYSVEISILISMATWFSREEWIGIIISSA